MKKLSKSRVEFEVVVAWDDWKKHIDQAVKEISEEIKVPGFRPGKAPKNLIEQKVGKGLVMNNAAEKAVKKSYVDFVTKEKLEILGQPEVEIEKLEEGKDFKYKATVDVMPEAVLEKEYQEEIKKINAEYKDKKPEIKEEEIEAELKILANSRVKLVTVLREAKKEDNVVVDFEVLMSGVPIENGTSKNHNLILGRGVFIPGFEENIIGMKEREEKEFELSFPSEYHKKDLAGKPATFRVKLNLVQERQIPEINDDFAKSLGQFENLESLKKSLREGMEKEEEQKIKEERRNKYVEEMVKKMKVEVPHSLTHQEIHKMLSEFDHQIQSMGMTMETYLAQIKKDIHELEKDWEPQAEKRVLSALALKEAVKIEEIKIEASEIEAEMNKTLQYYKKVKDFQKNVDLERLYGYTRNMLENEKLFEKLEKM